MGYKPFGGMAQRIAKRVAITSKCSNVAASDAKKTVGVGGDDGNHARTRGREDEGVCDCARD